jgi:hypothetical protein
VEQGYDESSAADLALVIESRRLGPGESDRLIRAVTGAVRPNRDKPFWDLAHVIAMLVAVQSPDTRDVSRGVIDLMLDPSLARVDTLRARLTTLLAAQPGAVQLAADIVSHGEWRASLAQIARSLALGEFMLTCGGLAHFKTVGQMIADCGPDPQLMTRQLVQLITGYRQLHMPAAVFERRFRAIMAHLGSTRAAVTDAAISSYWMSEIEAGERSQFRTVVEYFATFLKLRAVLADLAGVRGTGSLDAIENWQDRLDDMLADVAGEEAATAGLAARLAKLPETPKILTGAERDDAIAILGLDPFHKALPRTVLRAVSFGIVQSGIGNRLRRGGGGGTLTERLTCTEAAPYADILARASELADHVKRMVRIAVALRMANADDVDERTAAVVEAAEADIKRVRRAGFDLPRAALAEAFAGVDELLADTIVEIGAFLTASARLGGENTLATFYAEDRSFFSDSLTLAYAKEVADEHAIRA